MKTIDMHGNLCTEDAASFPVSLLPVFSERETGRIVAEDGWITHIWKYLLINYLLYFRMHGLHMRLPQRASMGALALKTKQWHDTLKRKGPCIHEKNCPLSHREGIWRERIPSEKWRGIVGAVYVSEVVWEDLAEATQGKYFLHSNLASIYLPLGRRFLNLCRECEKKDEGKGTILTLF